MEAKLTLESDLAIAKAGAASPSVPFSGAGEAGATTEGPVSPLEALRPACFGGERAELGAAGTGTEFFVDAAGAAGKTASAFGTGDKAWPFAFGNWGDRTCAAEVKGDMPGPGALARPGGPLRAPGGT
jgi:hypothetical protein